MKTNPSSTLADYCSHNSLEDNQTCTQYLNVVTIKYKSILLSVNTARAVNTQIVYVYIMTCKHQHELHDSVYSNYRQIHHRYSELGYMSFTQLMRTSTKTVYEHGFFYRNQSVQFGAKSLPLGGLIYLDLRLSF